MFRINRIIATLLAVLVASGLGLAQVKKSGLTGAAFLKVGVGARAVALGSAYTSIPDDVNQMFWNPAGIALPDNKWAATFSYNKWIADLNHNSGAIAHNFGSIGTLGLGLISFGISDIVSDRDAVPSFIDFEPTDTNTGNYSYQDLALSLSWARYFSDKISLGASFKYIRQEIDSQSANAVAFDFGAIYKIGFRNATIGARINNLGRDLKFYDIATPLPLIFSLGGSINLLENESNALRILADATKPQDSDQLLYAGGEYTFRNLVSVRGGYKLNYSGVTDTKRNEFDQEIIDVKRTEEGVTFGAGLRVPFGESNKAIVDYAFTEFGILDNVHRFSISVDF